MTKHVIELNGQKYDATTGRPVSTSSNTVKSHKVVPVPSGPKQLDGFTRRPGAARSTVPTKTLHAKTQKSQTLMRKVVKKPEAPAKIHAKVAAPTIGHQPASKQPRLEASKPGRAIRATSIGQSSLISKFGKTPPTIQSKVVPVKPAPAVVTAAPATKQTAIQRPAAHHAPKSQPASATKKNVFETAIENAASHETPKIKKARVHHRIAKTLRVSPRLVTFTGATLAVLLVGSVYAYQNMPEIAMKIASTRAGLNANLPAYQPAGFALAGPIEYNSGEVTLNYKSNSDERAFNVIQKNSGWNSETLLENFVETNSKPYQTFQANGRTIYIYDGNKATWVDGGVWYNIDGEANLNSDQLLKIAESL